MLNKEISPVIAELSNACLEAGYYPKQFWRAVTVALKKLGKLDYSNLSA